jgi:putative heme transporter
MTPIGDSAVNEDQELQVGSPKGDIPQSTSHRPSGGSRRRSIAIRVGLAVGIVAAVFFGVLPRLADMSEARHQAASMAGLDIATLGMLAIASALAYAFVLTAVMPGLSLAQAVVVNQSSTAVANTMPAGGVLGIGVSYRFYGSWGHSRSAITLNVLLTGIANIACKLALPIAALALLAVYGDTSTALILAAVVGLLVLAIALTVGAFGLSSERVAERIGRSIGMVIARVRSWFHRPLRADAGAVAMRFRQQAIELLRRRGARLTAGMLTYHATQFVLLFVSLRAVGVTAEQVSWVQALAGYSTAMVLGALPLTPGGIGVLELGLVGALIAAGGPNAEVVAAVLVYRTMSFLLPLPVGAITYFVWRWNTRWRRAPGSISPRWDTSGTFERRAHV